MRSGTLMESGVPSCLECQGTRVAVVFQICGHQGNCPCGEFDVVPCGRCAGTGVEPCSACGESLDQAGEYCRPCEASKTVEAAA